MKKPFFPFLSSTLVLQAAIQPSTHPYLDDISIIQLIISTIVHIEAILYVYNFILYVYNFILYVYNFILYVYNFILYMYNFILYVYNFILYVYKTTLYVYKTTLYVHKMVKVSCHPIFILQISPAINVSYLL